MNIQLLPHDKIIEGLNVVKEEVKLKVHDVKRVAKWDKMFAYVEGEWIRIVKPVNLTLFNALDRTDNNSETYHRDVNRDLGAKPDCPKFMGKNLNFFTND